MGYFMVFAMMVSLLMFSIPVIPKKADREKLAEDYYRNYVIHYYLWTNDFPSGVPSLKLYPYLSYSHSSNRATIRLFGKDRKPNTSDDVVITLTRTELDKKKYSITERRARVLEQAFYSVCQRRLSEGITPIYPSSLTELLNEADLPSWYGQDGFGHAFVYDTSTCHTDYCYCDEDVIRKN